jgi:hypothetical protein
MLSGNNQKIIVPVNFNPERQHSFALATYLKMVSYTWDDRRQDVYNHIIELLTSGENPNQCDESGITALWWVIVYFDTSFLELLIKYFANPFEVPTERHMKGHQNLPWGFDPQPAIEFTKMQSRKDKYDLIVGMFTKPNRGINKLFQVSSFERQTLNGVIYTRLKSNTELVELELHETSTLMNNDKLKKIFELYEKFFKLSPICKTTLEEFFKYEINGPLKFFEIINWNGKFAGAHLYEIIVLKDSITLHISCLFTEEYIRGRGITNPLVFTLPITLQDLFSQKNIDYVIQCIAVGSHKLVEGLVYFPMYRTHKMTEKAIEILPHIQRNPNLSSDPVTYTNTPTSFYSEIEVELNEDSKTPKTENHHSRFFNRLRGNPDAKDNNRGIEVIGQVNDQLVSRYKVDIQAMNIDSNAFVKDMSNHLREKLKDLKPEDNSNVEVAVPEYKKLYWQNVRVPSAVSIVPATKKPSSTPKN